MWFPMKEDYGQAILSLCAKTVTLFSAFPVFVPSLSWQIDRFYINLAQKGACSAGASLI